LSESAPRSAAGLSRRILLDECVPRPLRREFPGLDVSHVVDEGWSGRRNGDLLKEMLRSGFAVLVTVDRNLAYQQNVAAAGVAVVVVKARSNRVRDLRPAVPEIRAAIERAPVGVVTNVAV
jgi:hypothetical protein